MNRQRSIFCTRNLLDTYCQCSRRCIRKFYVIIIIIITYMYVS